MIDGGKGQLGVATAVFSDLGIEDLPHAGIAKARTNAPGERSPERFFLPGRGNPIVPPQTGAVVRVLERLAARRERRVAGRHVDRHAAVGRVALDGERRHVAAAAASELRFEIAVSAPAVAAACTAACGGAASWAARWAAGGAAGG